MGDEKAQPGAELLQALGAILDRLDPVVQVEGLAAARVLALEPRLDQLVVVLADVRANRAPALRRGLDE